MVLQANGVIDIRAWRRGGDLIQMGDMVDGRTRNQTQFHGGHDVDVLRFLTNLRVQARANGGDVRCLFGNHELMNLAGVFAYVRDEGHGWRLRCLPPQRRSDLRPARLVIIMTTSSSSPRRAGSDVFEAVATSRETLINGLLKAVVGSPMDVLMNRLGRRGRHHHDQILLEPVQPRLRSSLSC
jgi:hypothetical protein